MIHRATGSALAAVGLWLLASTFAAAQGEHRGGADGSYAPVVERIAPAVVSVYATLAGEPVTFGQASELKHATTQPEGNISFGSAVILDKDGLLMTTSHTIEGASEIKVALADSREYPAELVLLDRRSDLAVLRINARGPLPTIPFADSDRVRAGDIVIAVGNPYAVGQTITHGVVSAVGRTQLRMADFQYYIQTDAAMNPGNSGGALVGTDGRLVGIMTAIFSRSGGSQGIGFAVPSNMVSFVLDAAREGKTLIRRPWLGATLSSIDGATAARLGLEYRTGALIKSLRAGAPAEAAGLKVDDIVVAIDDHAISDPNALDYRLGMLPVSGKATLGILRGGERRTIDVALGAAPESRPRLATKIRAASPLQGATVCNLSPAVAEELGLEAGSDGVAVCDVDAGSTAQRMGFQRGDILLRVNNAKVVNAPDLARMLQKDKLRQVEVDRGGERLALKTNARGQAR
ncbi:MAG TPA: trypsin-like peptidase domain-containing protein [Xanthobacteraceae bacterium]|nr:trypsin-like peptidase domain-containing protein [Xanthobacteraceae bacterium]